MLCRGSGEQPPKVATAKITSRRGLGGWHSLWLEPFDIGEAVTVIPTSEYERLKRLDERSRRLIDAIDSPE